MTNLGQLCLNEIKARGYIFQQSHEIELAEKLNSPTSFYVGYDPTADSLHVGSVVTIMLARLLQSYGHKPIILMGGGTGKVGDPSGKDQSRQMLSYEQIDSNISRLKTVFEKFLSFDPALPQAAVILNNADWLDNLKYIDVLRDVGRHFTINRMLAFDSVKLRLEREHP